MIIGDHFNSTVTSVGTLLIVRVFKIVPAAKLEVRGFPTVAFIKYWLILPEFRAQHRLEALASLRRPV
jgi:hypothetical protein